MSWFVSGLVGSTNTCGGGGGRVAVYYTSSEWTGYMKAYGGEAEAERSGGAGTVFEEYVISGGTERRLTVDNGKVYPLWKRNDEKVKFLILTPY